MIQLAEDYLVFQSADGENIPFSAEAISIEVIGNNSSIFDTEFIKQAAAAVFHYYRDELDRQSVTVAEFSLALEKVLRGFSVAVAEAKADNSNKRIVRSDLCRLISESDQAGELFFFPRLRDELRSQLMQSPQMLCFQGIRQCVKQLARARRWTPRCQGLHDQIVDFLRNCMTRETPPTNCALVVK